MFSKLVKAYKLKTCCKGDIFKAKKSLLHTLSLTYTQVDRIRGLEQGDIFNEKCILDDYELGFIPERMGYALTLLDRFNKSTKEDREDHYIKIMRSLADACTLIPLSDVNATRREIRRLYRNA